MGWLKHVNGDQNVDTICKYTQWQLLVRQIDKIKRKSNNQTEQEKPEEEEISGKKRLQTILDGTIMVLMIEHIGRQRAIQIMYTLQHKSGKTLSAKVAYHIKRIMKVQSLTTELYG